LRVCSAFTPTTVRSWNCRWTGFQNRDCTVCFNLETWRTRWEALVLQM